MVTQAYTISTVKNAAPPRVKMSQYDHDSRTIVFTVVNGSGAVMDLTGKTVSVEGTRVDGHAFTVSCTVNGNNISFAETADMTNQAGNHSAELVVKQDGQRLGTMNFIILVEPAAMDENASITPEDQSMFEQLYGNVDDAVAEVDTAKNAALQEIAQGLASGSPLVANTAAEMTDTDEVYLYTGSESGYTAGGWYYYNGTAWVVGGVYGAGTTDATLSLAGVAADAKATGDAIGKLKNAFIYSKVNPYSLTTENPGYLTTSGSINGQSGTNLEVYSDFISLPSDIEEFTFKWWVLTANAGSAWIRTIFYDASKGVLEYASGSIVTVGEDGDYTLYKRTFTLPTGTVFVRISYRTFGNHKAQIVYGEDSNYGLSATDLDANIIHAATPSYAFDHIGIRGIAHRGFCRDGAPENTIHAFRAAVTNGFDFIEGDLRFTSDGIPVLLHDASINRTARNADGTEIATTINIANITYAQALTYDFGVWAGSEYAGTKIPTLYEFLYFCRDTGSYPYIDCSLTSAARVNLVTVAQKIVDMGMQDRITFISSNELVLQAYLSVYPKFRVGLLLNGELNSERQKVVKLLMSAFNRVFLNCNVNSYTTYQTSVDAFCEAQGIELELWTIDSSEKINSLPNIVRGVTSNAFNFKVIKRQTAMGTNN